jgi:hypothetical protein
MMINEKENLSTESSYNAIDLRANIVSRIPVLYFDIWAMLA